MRLQPKLFQIRIYYSLSGLILHFITLKALTAIMEDNGSPASVEGCNTTCPYCTSTSGAQPGAIYPHPKDDGDFWHNWLRHIELRC